MKKKIPDTLYTGIIIGFILPVLVFLFIILAKKGPYSFGIYFRELSVRGAIPRLLTLCLLPNVILFFTFIRNDHLKSARGVIISMILIGIVIIILKFT